MFIKKSADTSCCEASSGYTSASIATSRARPEGCFSHQPLGNGASDVQEILDWLEASSFHEAVSASEPTRGKSGFVELVARMASTPRPSKMFQ
jgi:hypothetical protein